ncbi:MAG: hypothetical protein L0323_01390, partial [Planctomycetes bacterium]|nr:hypothetical protein [Planctomycetota bacterium]
VAGGRGPIDAAVEGAVDLWTYRMERALVRHGMATLDGREKAAKELVDVVTKIGDPVWRELAFRLLAERTSVPESILRSEARPPRTAGKGTDRPEAPHAWVQAEQDFLRAGIEDGELWTRIERSYPPERFRDGGLRLLARALADLRGRGESVTREGLLSVLADKDEAVRALQALEPAADARQRTEVHLAQFARDAAGQERSPFVREHAGSDFAAVVQARRGASSVQP